MKIAIKYLILLFGFVAGFYSLTKENIGSGIASAGAFIAYALIEIQDLRTTNEDE